MAVDNDANQAICPALLAHYAFLLGLPHTSIQPLSIHPEGIFSFHLIDLPGNIFYNLLFLSSGLYTSLDTTSMSSFNFPNTSFFSSPPAPSFRKRLIQTQARSALLMLLKFLPQQETGPRSPRYLKGSIAIHSAGRNLYSAPPTPYPKTSITTHPARRAFFSTPHKHPLSIHPSGRTLSTTQPC